MDAAEVDTFVGRCSRAQVSSRTGNREVGRLSGVDVSVKVGGARVREGPDPEARLRPTLGWRDPMRGRIGCGQEDGL